MQTPKKVTVSNHLEQKSGTLICIDTLVQSIDIWLFSVLNLNIGQLKKKSLKIFSILMALEVPLQNELSSFVLCFPIELTLDFFYNFKNQ